MKSNLRVAGEILGAIVLVGGLVLSILAFVVNDNIKDNKIRQDECVSYYNQNKPTSEDAVFIRQCGYVGIRHFLEN